MRCRSMLVTGIAMMGCLSVVAWSSAIVAARPPMAQGTKAVPATDATVKAGATVYARMCRSCHGLLGKGDGIAAPPGTKPANLVDAEWKYGGTDAEIFKNIREGIKPYDVMRPQKGLSDEDIWSVIHHLRALAARANAKK